MGNTLVTPSTTVTNTALTAVGSSPALRAAGKGRKERFSLSHTGGGSSVVSVQGRQQVAGQYTPWRVIKRAELVSGTAAQIVTLDDANPYPDEVRVTCEQFVSGQINSSKSASPAGEN